MATALGLVGSARLWGNSEIVVREALLGAQEEGAKVEMLRLTDLSIEPCNGCLRCAIREELCPLDDDMEWFLAKVRESDALVLSAPTYMLGPAAIVKLILDRLLMLTPCFMKGARPTKPGATIALSGRRDLRGVTQPFLNALVMGLGFRLADSLYVHQPGPGEVSLDDEMMVRIHELGRRLALGEGGKSPEGNICPSCYGDFFVLEGGKATCPLCGLEAAMELVDSQVRLTFDLGVEPWPWSYAWQKEHVEEWIRPTVPRFLAHREEIKARRKRYQGMDEVWIGAPSL